MDTHVTGRSQALRSDARVKRKGRQVSAVLLSWPSPADDSVSGNFVLNLWPEIYERSEVLEAIGLFKSSSLGDSFRPRYRPWSGVGQGRLPTLGKSTMPHFMKILINQYPNCAIEANLDIVEVPGKRQMTWPHRSKQSGVNAAFLQGFVLILSWGIDVNCNDQRIPASNGECVRRTNPA